MGEPTITEKLAAYLDAAYDKIAAPEEARNAGEAPAAALTFEQQRAAGEALAKMTEIAFKVSSLFGEHPNALVVSLAASGDPETADLLETLKAWKKENEDDDLKQIDLGYHYLMIEQDYEKAVLCFQAAEEINPLDTDAKLYLGQAFFGLGDFKASLQYYGGYLAHVPSDAQVRELRIEALQEHVKTLDQAKDASEIEIMETEILRERAMLVALRADTERRDLKDLADRLMKSTPQSPEEAKALADQIHRLAQNYIALGSVTYLDPEETERVRGELNALAGDTFQILCAFTSASVYEDINKLTPLYEAYYHLSQGDVENAVDKLGPIRGEFPEAEAILTKIEGDRLRSMNLAALEAWRAFIKDGEAVELDQARSWQGSLVDGLSEVFGDGTSAVSHVHDRWTTERKLLDRVKTLLIEGKCKTIREGLEIVSGEDDGASFHHPSVRAKKILDEVAHDDPSHAGTYALAHLIQYTSTLEPDPKVGGYLLDDADRLFAEYSAVETPYALSALVKALSRDEGQKASAQKMIDTLVDGKSLGRSVWDMVRTMGTDDIAQIGIMYGATAVGSMAKLATLNKLKDAGITGYKAVLLAGGAEILAEGTTLFALNTAYEATQHDTDKIFSTDHLLASYGSSLVMVGGLKIFGAAGNQLAPRFARALGLVEEGGLKLSQGGSRLAWATGHAFGLGGMVATNQINRLLGLASTPPGGFSESLVHDLFGYAKYAIAQKGFERAMGPEAAKAADGRRREIALREAETMAESKLNKMGYKTEGRTDKGDPIFKDARGRRLYGEMVYLSLACPGFDAAKIEDPDYLGSLGLKARTKDGAIVGFKKIPAHEAMGVKAGKKVERAIAPARGMIPADAVFASGAVPLFATLVGNGVPVGAAVLLAGAALIVPAAARKGYGESYAPGTEPGAEPAGPMRGRDHLAADLARMNEYLGNLRRLDLSALQGKPGFGDLARTAQEFQASLDQANILARELRTAGPIAKEHILKELDLRLGRARELMNGISAEYRRLNAPAAPDVRGPKFDAPPDPVADPYDQPANRDANPVEKLLYLQAAAIHQAKCSGREPAMSVRINLDGALRPTGVAVTVSADAKPREVSRLKALLGLEGGASLEAKTYEIEAPDRTAPEWSNERPAARRIPVTIAFSTVPDTESPATRRPAPAALEPLAIETDPLLQESVRDRYMEICDMMNRLSLFTVKPKGRYGVGDLAFATVGAAEKFNALDARLDLQDPRSYDPRLHPEVLKDLDALHARFSALIERMEALSEQRPPRRPNTPAASGKKDFETTLRSAG